MRARLDAEAAREASEARFRAVFAGTLIGIGVADTHGCLHDVNQSLCEMFGYAPDELRGRRLHDLVDVDDLPGYPELAAGSRDHLRLEQPLLRKDGVRLWTDLVLSLIRDQAGTPRYVVAMAQDITERYLLQTRLRHQALHDPLTRLPNRTLFFERLSETLAAGDGDGSRVGVCYLDIDGFKMINDTLGHDMGDRFLLTVARRLDATVTAPSQLVARIGGDEFVVLVERSTGTGDMVKVAEAALAAVREPVRLGGHAIAMSASVGVVERPCAGTTAGELMKAADTTLFLAKSDGRNQWALFDAERHAHEVSRFALAADLPAALERGEFVVEYQPLVRLRDAATVGMEALVRWRHPVLGRLGPDRFIGLTEETGLIVPLGRWVLTEACRQATAWLDACPGLLVSVNLAPRQMRDPGVVDDVAAALAESGLEPGALQLELTESAVVGSGDEPLRRLHALAGLGVRLAIDDFGTGYSNLVYLRDLPVHGLKLAGPFVAGLGRSGDGVPGPSSADEKIVATLVDLAHALGLTVTAEGVETGPQADRLRALGCDTAQGWYYAPALPPERIGRELTRRPSGTAGRR
jgi:diguanylate cyclase (GGDEF)-like protein/PAS domain S-box-containing protein